MRLSLFIFIDALGWEVLAERKFLEKELLLIDFEVLSSGANFIFTRHKSKDAITIFKKLRESGVLVRHFSEPERISQFLRITIGTMEDMQKLISILKAIL